MSKAQSALRHHLDQIAEAELVAQGRPRISSTQPTRKTTPSR